MKFLEQPQRSIMVQGVSVLSLPPRPLLPHGGGVVVTAPPDVTCSDLLCSGQSGFLLPTSRKSGDAWNLLNIDNPFPGLWLALRSLSSLLSWVEGPLGSLMPHWTDKGARSLRDLPRRDSQRVKAKSQTVKSEKYGIRLQLLRLLPLWTWTNHFSSLVHGFLRSKTGDIVATANTFDSTDHIPDALLSAFASRNSYYCVR